MAFKIVIGDPNTKKSYQVELDKTNLLIGKKIGESIDGSILGLDGYELRITGGSDITGNPMRMDVDGSVSKRLLLSKGIGFRSKRRGERRKKRVHGNEISSRIVQVNMKVVKSGSKPIDQLLKPAEKEETQKEKPGPKPETEAPKEQKSEEKAPEQKEKPSESEQKKEA